jgi:hypothetical protein
MVRMVGEPAEGEAPEAALLGNGDGLERRAVGSAPARLDLTEHERMVGGQDEVELPFATSPVAPEHGVAGVEVPLRDHVLAGHPEASAVVGHVRRPWRVPRC